MGLAGLLTVSAVMQYAGTGTLPVVAAREDTLPGVESIREEYITTGETFQILEIAPDVSAGEIGYYVDGQEPLPLLASEESGKWLSWREILSTLETQEEREAFMEELQAQASEADDSFLGIGTSPLSFQKYKERTYTSDDEALKDGANYIDVKEKVLRGYFEAATGEDAQWNVVFERLRDNLTVEEVNTGKDTPYYRVTDETQLTGLDLKKMAENPAQANTIIYVDKEGYYEYAGTAADVWKAYEEQIKEDTVSDGDADVSGGDADVSDGDADISDGDTDEPSGDTGNEGNTDVSGGDVSDGNTVNSRNTTVSGGNTNGEDETGNAQEPSTEQSQPNEGETEPKDPAESPVEPPVVDDSLEKYQEMLKELTDYYIATFSMINNVPENQISVGSRVTVYITDVKHTHYVKEDGNYQMVITEKEIAAGENYAIPAERVYYKGGIQNKDFLRAMAFGVKEQDAEALKISVHTYTPDMVNLLTKEEIEQYDMIYIGNAALWNGKSEVVLNYQNDIDATHMEYLASYVVTSKIPCIVDISEVIEKGTEDNVSRWLYKGAKAYPNLDKLILLLISTNKDRFFVDNEDGNNYNTLHDEFKKAYDWNLGAAGFTLTDMVEKDGEALNESILAVDGAQINANTPELDVNGDYVDLHFVKENVWAFYGKDQPFIQNGFGDSTYDATSEVPYGFQVVLDEIVTENLYRGADISATLLEEVVNDSTVLRYLLNYQKRRTVTQKVGVHILEIQPATKNSSLRNTKDKAKEYETIAKWLGIDPLEITKKKVTITTMPITQFIGIIDDLNDEYDMIYFGDSVEGFYTQEIDGQDITDYNDDNMDGLLYSHVGDRITTVDMVSGLLDTDIGYDDTLNLNYLKQTTVHRYSGNDLTLEKYNALMDYIDAGYPIVVADSLVKLSTGGDETNQVNGDRIDNSSYLYEFLNNAFKTKNGKRSYKNIFRVNDVAEGRNSDFNFYINRAKLQMPYEPILIGAEAYNADDADNVVKTIDKQLDGKYYLHFQFEVQNVGAVSPNTEYTCKLYLDSNADGKFSTINEELSALEIVNKTTGERVNSTALKAGQTYIASRQIPEGYMGCITWKLEVQQSNNNLIRTAHTGYVKLKTEEATIIRILQIYFHSTYRDNLILEKRIPWDDANSTYVEKDNIDKTTDPVWNFYDAAYSIKDDYLLNVTSISKSQFITYVNNGCIENGENLDGWMEQFDMLIVGFSDAYSGTMSNDWTKKSIDKIKEFIDSGRSVLLSHDMTSIVSAPPEVLHEEGGKLYYNYEKDGIVRAASDKSKDFPEWYWGYNMNRYLRNMLSMDMYGITMSYSGGGEKYQRLQTGVGMTEADNLFGILKRQADPETGRYLDYNVKELAYTPKSGRTSTVPEVQGYTYGVLSARGAISGEKTYRKGVAWDGADDNRTKYAYTVSRTNEGQITNYPYYIQSSDYGGEKISVAETHTQYYTLDMNSDSDMDGQTDLVVWYCLDNGQEDYYKSSYQDVRNNYYIYSKGNITYTGMGHHAYFKGAHDNYPYERVSLDEAKLFINTMIASYQAGKRSPQISLTDESGVEIDTIYNFYEFDTALDAEEKVRIYYSLQDLNMVSGVRTMEVKYFVEDRATATPDNRLEDCPVRELTNVITYDKDGNVVDDSQLKVDTVYYVEIPASYLASSNANGNQVEFFIGAKTYMTTTSINDGSTRTEESAWGYDGISYLNCDLMELD